jgi:hypothetical protein
MKRRARKNERGYALLLVFLMASAIAIMLYRQLPREAFESERDKEQMLIDRGEQYKRAIYLYYIGNNRQWPSKIEDLEKTNDKRYLRHRYVNPYTGKDEWRLIHTNGTFLTDSLVTPPPAQATPGSPGTTAAAPLGGTGTLSSPSLTASTTDPNAPPEVNAQVQRRPSDRTLVQNSNFQNQPGGQTNPTGNDPGYQPFNPSALPPISLYPNGYNAPPTNAPGSNGTGGLPGLNQPVVNQNGINQPGVNQPGVNQPGGVTQPGVPGFTIPGTNSPVTTPGVNPTSFNPTSFNQPGGNQPINPATNQPFPTQPFPGQQFPGQQNQPNVPGNVPGFGAAPVAGTGPAGIPGGASNPAINLINNLLTTPRQAPAGVGQQPQNGGGLAGVASVYKGPSIKSYGDRTKYQEWEFVFQLNAQGTLQTPKGAGPTGQTPGGPGATTGTPGAPGTPGSTGAPGSTTQGGTTPNSTGPGTPGGFGNN